MSSPPPPNPSAEAEEKKSPSVTIANPRPPTAANPDHIIPADPSKAPLPTQPHQQAGISRIEAFSRLFPRSHPVALTLYLCIFLVACSFSLDQSTTAAYDVYATAAFNRQSYIGTIEIVEGIIVAVSKPFIAKICDVSSRQTAYLIILASYVVGYIVVATAPTAPALCVGRVISATGQAGFDLVTDIVVADLSPLQWRGLMGSMTSFPYLFLPFVGSLIQASLCTGKTDTCWRWGYGMFCIIATALVSPIIVTLWYADNRAKKAGELLSLASSRVQTRRVQEQGQEGQGAVRMGAKETWGVFAGLLEGIDFVGLLLLAIAFSLILLPFSLAAGAGGWDSPSMIAMEVCGFVALGLFIAYEVLWARFPILNRRVWHNKTFLAAVVLDIFYMMSGNVRSTFYSSWVLVITDWSNYEWGNFVAMTTVALTFFGLLAGLYHRAFHRYKALQLFGLSVRLIGLGISYWAVGPNATTAALVMSQLLGAMGGACSVVGTRVASQASVPHQDLAGIIAQLSLWTKLGSSVGSAVSSQLYTSTYLANLAAEGLSSEEAAVFYGSSTAARTRFPWGSPEREAGIRAFTATMRPMFLASLCLSFIPLLAGLVMPNYYLGRTQNVVDGTTNGGLVIEMGEEEAAAVAYDEAEVRNHAWYAKMWRGLKN